MRITFVRNKGDEKEDEEKYFQRFLTEPAATTRFRRSGVKNDRCAGFWEYII